MAFGRIIASPTFARKSPRRGGIQEFWMVEPEMAYVDLWGNMRSRSSS